MQLPHHHHRGRWWCGGGGEQVEGLGVGGKTQRGASGVNDVTRSAAWCSGWQVAVVVVVGWGRGGGGMSGRPGGGGAAMGGETHQGERPT